MPGNLLALALAVTLVWPANASAAPAPGLDQDNDLALLSDSFWRQATPTDLDTWLAPRSQPGEYPPGVVTRNTTAFHLALENNASLAMLQHLRAALPAMVGLGDYPESLLSTAIKHNHPTATIEWLLAQGAPVEAGDYHNPRPLLLAIAQGADASLIDALVKAGADTSYFTRSDSNMDAFDAAVLTEHSTTRRAVARHLPLPEAGSETMEAILVELSRQGRDGPDAPHVSYDILSVLLERGMSSTGTYCDPHKPYCLADDRSDLMDLAIRIEDPQLVDYLLGKGLKAR
ncbi:hypothetical protein [Pseudomonas sp. BRM28]|uniref:hypothetical protein n=1 Tax=Pseudomonas TaxID=286 RepID=UPI000CEE18D6|nr:hypothetical protein [Pseudomonas sp. BRM28]PPS62886.1 hypothetical protein CR917_18755 [Pseudomonas sp. BRM28]